MKVGCWTRGGASYLLLRNRDGFRIVLSDLGASVRDISWKGRTLVVSPREESVFLRSPCQYGKSIGRIAGRIPGGTLSFLGERLELEESYPGCTMHGGPHGFSMRTFRMETSHFREGVRVTFSLLSPDGEGGFPGELHALFHYFVPESGAWFRYESVAFSNKATPYSPTLHLYFNLGGEEDILSHRLLLPSESILETDERLFPIGRKEIEKGGPFDFSEERGIGERIEDPALRSTGGYDHTFYLEKGMPILLRNGGLSLRIETDFPAVQLYTDNRGSGLPLTNGKKEADHAGVAIEPFYPLTDIRAMGLIPMRQRKNVTTYLFEENP